jgi:RimJ/RimL family protein N-acetyltransferase
MSGLPGFETERLIVRPRTLADLPACLAMDRDPQVTQFIAGPWSDPVAHEAFVRTRIETDFGEGLGYWSIVTREAPDHMLGWILLIPYEGSGPEIDIGWRLTRAAWGKGYAREAVAPVLDHAFETVRLSRVVADIDARNTRSIAVATKIGMRDAGGIDKDGIACRAFVLTAGEYREGKRLR